MAGVGGLVGGLVQGRAAKKAADAQARALGEATRISQENFEESAALLQPTIDLGSIAQQAIAFDRGLGPAPVISREGFEVAGRQFGTRDEARDFLDQARADFNSASRVTRPITTRDIPGENGTETTRLQTSFDPDRAVQQLGFDPREASIAEVDPITYGGFEFSPDHEFLMKEGLDAVSSQASATGARNSGATLQALQERGTNLANTFREQYLASLGALSAQGQNAINSRIAAGNINSTNASNNAIQLGNSQAASAIAQGNAFSGAIQGGFSLLGSLGGFGGGGGLNAIQSGLNSVGQSFTGSAAPFFSPAPTARPSLSF